MVEITFENNDAILKFPKDLFTKNYVQQFLDRLRLEAILEKSELTEEKAWELSEQLKQDWWNKNKSSFLKKEKK